MKPLIGGWREDEAKFHVQEAKVGNSSPWDWDTREMGDLHPWRRSKLNVTALERLDFVFGRALSTGMKISTGSFLS